MKRMTFSEYVTRVVRLMDAIAGGRLNHYPSTQELRDCYERNRSAYAMAEHFVDVELAKHGFGKYAGTPPETF